jgi:hypothetical protein
LIQPPKRNDDDRRREIRDVERSFGAGQADTIAPTPAEMATAAFRM